MSDAGPVRVTHWTDWLGLLAGATSLGLTLFLGLATAAAVWFRLIEPFVAQGTGFVPHIYHLSRPSFLGLFLAFSLPVPVLTAALGAAGLALVHVAGPPAGRFSVPATAARYARVGLTAGVGLTALLVGSAVVLLFLRWCYWG